MQAKKTVVYFWLVLLRQPSRIHTCAQSVFNLESSAIHLYFFEVLYEVCFNYTIFKMRKILCYNVSKMKNIAKLFKGYEIKRLSLVYGISRYSVRSILIQSHRCMKIKASALLYSNTFQS